MRKITRASLAKGLRKIIADGEQFIRDVNYWNNCHPSDPPFDLEDMRITVAGAKKQLAAVLAGEFPIPDHLAAGRASMEAKVREDAKEVSS